MIYEVQAQHKSDGSLCPVEISLSALFWNISITSNHGIVAESPSIKSFLVTAAVYYDSVQRVNCSSSFMGMFIRNCSVDASSDALDFGVLVCMMLLGPELEQWEASCLSVCDLQCLWSCFQQDWAHPCLLYCSGCLICWIHPWHFAWWRVVGMLSAVAEKDARLLFLLLFVVKPYKVHPGPHENGLVAVKHACTFCLSNGVGNLLKV